MSRLLLMLMAPLAQSAFDPELAGPASVLVRGFWPLQVDRISVADSQVDVSGTFDINFMFLGPDLDMATYYGSEEDSSGSTLDYLTSMKVNPPGVTDGGSYKGYTQYDISRDAETMANVNTWMNNNYFFPPTARAISLSGSITSLMAGRRFTWRTTLPLHATLQRRHGALPRSATSRLYWR